MFARIGWMTFYAGAVDEKPTGGGSYNRDRVGSEVFNFKPVNGFLYGFARGGSKNAFNLKRIDPTAPDTNKIEHVLVVFVAKQPDGGQRVVGWYKDATVYGVLQKHPIHPQYIYSLAANSRKSCLLPTHWRTEPVPTGRENGIGQSNVCYVVRDGKINIKPWMKKILSYVDSYDGPNLLKDRSTEAENTEKAEAVIETSYGFESNPEIRRAIENYSVQRAKRYFEALEYKVEIKGRPYDLLCTRDQQTKYVEVKGTRSDGGTVVLTRNEVAFLNKNRKSALMFVLHDIKVISTGNRHKVFGGKSRLIEPWDPKCGAIKPITFFLNFHQKV